MPDISTHLMIGAAIAIILGKDIDRKQLMMILVGSIIIDIERPITWVLQNSSFYWLGLTGGFHSILGAVLLSIFAASVIVFESAEFRTRIGLVLTGALSHLLMDMTMWPWGERGIYLFYPLKISFSFQLFWPDFVFYPVIGFCVLITAFVIRKGFQYRTDDSNPRDVR